MGCVMSSIDEDGRISTCKERKRVIKQLVGIREEFSDSLLAYFKALRNTGSTLRQFTESDTLEFEIASHGLAEPPSPPAYVLPPPLPPFLADKSTLQGAQEETLENDDNYTLKIHPGMNSSQLFQPTDKKEIVESVEEENWEETKTEFEDEEPEIEAAVSVGKSSSAKQKSIEAVDDNSSAMSLYRKDTTAAMPMVVGRNEKTLEGIVKEIDDYFLIASACLKEVAVLIDVRGGDTLLREDSGHLYRKRGNSAKVFSVLSWSRHSKSTQFPKDATDVSGPGDPCRPGAHCVTLKKLCAAEKKLYKAIKEEGVAKFEFERKSLLLQKQEDENVDVVKIDKTRSNVEELESDIISLRQSINETTSSILELIDEELLPQLVALNAGLAQMWRKMHECHQAQALISQQLIKLDDYHNTMLNSDHHHQATIQFESEASYWYSSFCKLVKSQQAYVKTLCKWVQLTSCLRDDHECSDHSSIRTICEQWQLGLDTLPDKMVSDAIKDLISSIRAIVDQQAEEDNIMRKLEKLERRLQKDLNSFEWSLEDDGAMADISPKHPLYLKKTKIEALKNQVESVNADYLDSIQHGKTMTLNNLKTALPRLFQSLMEFSSVSEQAMEAIHAQSSQENVQ